MFDLVEHVPIKSKNVKIFRLSRHALDKLEARAAKLRYEFAGEARFTIIELPLSTYLECRVAVAPLDLEQLAIDKLRGIE